MVKLKLRTDLPRLLGLGREEDETGILSTPRFELQFTPQQLLQRLVPLYALVQIEQRLDRRRKVVLLGVVALLLRDNAAQLLPALPECGGDTVTPTACRR